MFYPLRTTWYGFTNTWRVALGAAALIPEPLRGVPSGLFGTFSTPDAQIAHPAVTLLPAALRGVPSEVFGVALTFFALAVLLFVNRQLHFNTDVQGPPEQT